MLMLVSPLFNTAIILHSRQSLELGDCFYRFHWLNVINISIHNIILVPLLHPHLIFRHWCLICTHNIHARTDALSDNMRCLRLPGSLRGPENTQCLPEIIIEWWSGRKSEFFEKNVNPLYLLFCRRNRSYSDKDRSSDSDSRGDVIIKAPPPKPIRRNPGTGLRLSQINRSYAYMGNFWRTAVFTDCHGTLIELISHWNPEIIFQHFIM